MTSEAVQGTLESIYILQEAMESSAFPNNLQCMQFFCQMAHTQKTERYFYTNLVGQRKFHWVFGSTPHRFAVISEQSVRWYFPCSSQDSA